MKIRALINHAELLPIEERAFVVDSLLRSLNPPDPIVDENWAIVAEQRLNEIRSGKVETVSLEVVFANPYLQREPGYWKDRFCLQ